VADKIGDIALDRHLTTKTGPLQSMIA
jgi:hypothetical protein